MGGMYTILIISMLFLLTWSTGCTSQSDTGSLIPTPTTSAIQAKFVTGDIIAKTASSPDQFRMILKYDPLTEKYERASVQKKSDGRWYRNNKTSEFTDRALTEKIYPVKVGHVSSLSLVSVETSEPVTLIIQTISSKQGTPVSPTPSIPSHQSLLKKVPAAQFRANVTQGKSPLTVQFTDKSDSTGSVSYAWDVNNDGITDYTIQNPVHTYLSPGNYTVKLIVTNASGSGSEIKTNYITVSSVQSGVLTGTGNFGAESNPTGNPIGGGAGYTRIISGTETNVKYIVSTKDQLIAALKNAQSGEVVFVKGNAVIDLTETPSVTIPQGVTLASDRGLMGSSGALIKRTRNLNGNYEEPMFIADGDTIRITGLRLQGEMYAQDYGNKKGETSQQYYLVGIYAENKKGFEVDNCELYGWAWSTISLRGNTDTPIPYIHHNYIHHNQARGEGYGVNLYGGNALIEANLFDYNRHDVTGAGMTGEQYEARYNRHLGHGNAIGAANYDVHQDEETGTGLAGNLFKIHHNTIDGGIIAMLQVRGKPKTGMYVYNNVINSVASDTGVTGDKPIFQTSAGTGNMFVTQNYWKDTLYPTDDGIVEYY
jgi:PKD repeat protein